MAVDGSLIFDTKIDTKDFAKGTNTIKNQANGLKSTFVSLGKAIAGAFIIKKSIDLGKQATELASDLEEVQNVVDTAFGEMSDKMEQFAKTSVESFGMSKLAAKQTGSTYMAMAKNMIKSQEVASDMAVTLTGLTGDWASFYNVTTQEAATALNAIFTGETETIKRFGFIMTEANLQSYALSKGMKQRISDMTQEEKVLLRYNFIMEKSAMVQGDFAKTSGSWANQTRILKEQWKEFMTVLGQGIIQFLTPAIQFLNRAMQYMIALAKATGEVLSAVFGFNIEISDSASAVSSGAEDATENIIAIGDAAEEAGKKAAKAVAPFDKLNEVANAEIKGSALGGIDKINPEGAIEAGGAIGAINKGIGEVDDKIQKMVENIKPVLQNIVDLFGKIKPLIIGIAEAFIAYKIVDLFMNLGGAIGALNPTAGVIALAVLAFGTIYAAIKEYNKKLLAEDLAGRFGDISLSLEEIETIAERLTTSKYSANIDVFVTEKQKLEQIEKGIKADVDTLNKLDWKVSVGLALTEGEISQYKSTIESFIANSNDYIDQQQYIVSLALQATITNDGNFLSEMTTAANLYYDATRGEMEALGKKLREAYDLAFADGVLDSQEQELIWNIRKEMTDVMQKAADLEFQAQLKKLAIDYGNTELTAESWEALTEKIQEFNKDRLDGLEEAELVGIQSIMMRYNLRLDEAKNEEERKKITAEMEGVLAQYAQEVSETEATITLQGIDIQLDTLVGNYEDALKKVAPNLTKTTEELFGDALISDIKGTDTKEALDYMVLHMTMNYEQGLAESGLSRAARKGLKEMLEALEPTTADLEKLYLDAIATGQKVPDGVTEALTDINNLKALTGDMDAIAFLMGQKMSTDPMFLDVLAKSETAGEDLGEYFIAGMKSKHLSLKKAGKDLVLVTDKAITKEANIVKKTTIPTSAGAIIGGFGNKFTKDKTTKSAVKTWLDGINNMILNYKMDTVKIRAEFFGMELPGITGSKQNYLKYPQYASGNVIPANYGNFLATLGDNKREPEVVSPLSTMKQAMKEAMAEMGGAGGEYTFIAQLDGKTLYKETVNQDQMQRKVTGKSAFSY